MLNIPTVNIGPDMVPGAVAPTGHVVYAAEIGPEQRAATQTAVRTAAAVTTAHTTVEKEVRAYFKDAPILAEIAYCESEFEQVDPATGQVKRGWQNPADIGVMQINVHYHGATAKAMGLDLDNLYDNMAFARYLYDREGTRPWNASKYCWGPAAAIAMR
jgi:hypothetical protein